MNFPTYNQSPRRVPLRAGRRVPKLLFWGCVVVLPWTFASAVHRLQPRTPDDPRPILAGAAVPLEVQTIIQRSCRDCHSDNTILPWYSHIAPLSWMVEGDVRSGRGAMNLSHWTEYAPAERRAWLREVGPLVQNRLMPLPRYILIHRGAKLSSDEIRVLSEWAETERHRLRPALIDGVAKQLESESAAE